MKNLVNKQTEQEDNQKSDFENFAFKNKIDLLDKNELYHIKGGDEEDLINDWE